MHTESQQTGLQQRQIVVLAHHLNYQYTLTS